MKTLALVLAFPLLLALCLALLALLLVGAAIFGPLVSLAGIRQLPHKFYDYAT